METDAVIREAIRAEMKKRNLTQQQLADMMGVQQSSIARLLSGKRSKQPSMLLKILDTLGLELKVEPKR
jgi:HTH-type transcriptional regulator/antitoxin HipB